MSVYSDLEKRVLRLVNKETTISALAWEKEAYAIKTQARKAYAMNRITHDERKKMELIDKQAALVAVKDALMAWSYMPEWRDDKILEAIAELPPAQPKKGKWILDGHHVRCDKCGMYMCNTDREGDPIPSFFCPNCGADMKEVTT